MRRQGGTLSEEMGATRPPHSGEGGSEPLFCFSPGRPGEKSKGSPDPDFSPDGLREIKAAFKGWTPS